MSNVTTKRTKILAWNGITLLIPNSWESRFPKSQHVVFEKDFVPQLQVRWEKTKPPSPEQLRKKLADFSNSDSILEKETLPPRWSALNNRFDLLLLAKGGNFLTSGIFFCKTQKLIFLFEIMHNSASAVEDSAKALASLGCGSDKSTQWQFGDFSFVTPDNFALANYTFAAGLTRLSFKTAELTCHICRLSPAHTRLQQQSLNKILETLAGSNTFCSFRKKDTTVHSLKREPSVWKQIKDRLRRRHPFILAEILHDEQYNHLLAVVFSSKQPITMQPADIVPKLA